MIAADTEGIEFGNILRTEFDHITDQPDGRGDREDPGSSPDVFFENIILGGASHLIPGYALFLCDCQIHGQHHRSHRVDSQRSADFIDRDIRKSLFQIPESVYGHPHPADFFLSKGIIRIKAQLRRQVKSHIECCLPLLQKPFKPLIRLFGRAEA